MDIKDDALLKAACHGIIIGCLLPVIAYNMSAKKTRNLVIYTLLIGFEMFNVVDHLLENR